MKRQFITLPIALLFTILAVRTAMRPTYGTSNTCTMQGSVPNALNAIVNMSSSELAGTPGSFYVVNPNTGIGRQIDFNGLSSTVQIPVSLIGTSTQVKATFNDDATCYIYFYNNMIGTNATTTQPGWAKP